MDPTAVPSTSRKRPHNSENLPVPSTSLLQPKTETEHAVPIKKTRAFSPEVPAYQQHVKTEPVDTKEPPMKTEPWDEKPSIQADLPSVLSLSNEILQPDTTYHDLGYVIKDLHALLPNSTWRTQVCSFWFFPMETDSTHSQLILLQKLYSFRLLYGSTNGTSIILVPPAASAHFGACLKGSVQFTEEPDVALDALRHFLPASDESGLLSGIPLPTVPVCKKTGFVLGGKAFPPASLPKVRPGPGGREQGLYFVGVVDVEQRTVRVDVYMAGDFFDERRLENVADERETKGDVNGYQRLATVLNMGKEIVVQDNPIMEALYVDNIYEQLRKKKDKCRLLGDIADLTDLNRLFATVQSQHIHPPTATHPDPQHPNLKLKLHAYQKRAVSWMIDKERAVLQNRLMPHPLYFPYETVGGRRMYMHVLTKRLSDHLPEVKRPRGGILADEMGLGKTLETIALVLNHPSAISVPRNPDGVVPDTAVEAKKVPDCYCGNRRLLVDLVACVRCGITHHKSCVGFEHVPAEAAFLCSRCQNGHRIESKTTLVVAPASVVPQWEFEIAKSARNLQVMRYNGVAARNYISPWMLAKYDIVLVSYEILSEEALGGEGVRIVHNKMVKTATVRCPRRETLRNKLELRSPLLAIQFHRFILDEAQMVETQTAHYAQMAMQIRAHTYWAVSGTPIQNGPADLQALFSFIEYSPWMYWRWFEEYLLRPYQAGIRRPLEDALGECLWRMDKLTVEREVALPVCTTEVHVLKFSGIEMQLYKDVYRDCVKAVGRSLRAKATNPATWNKRLREFSGEFVQEIRLWMDRLEKLCLSPMRVKYYFKEMRLKKKIKQRSVEETSVQPDEGDSLRCVVHTLLAKSRRELRDTLQSAIAICIDIAGLRWLNGDYVEAAKQYRRALQLFMDNSEHVKIAVTQRLHILINLRELVTEHDGQVQSTLEDDRLEQEAQSVRDEFYAENLAARTELMHHVDVAWEVVEWVVKEKKKIMIRSQMPHDKEALKQAIGPLFGAMDEIGKCPEDDLELVHKCKMAALVIAPSDLARGGKERSRAMDVTYHTLKELQCVLDDRWEMMAAERISVISQIQDMVTAIWTEDDPFLQEWTHCHLDKKSSQRRCRLCAIGKHMLAYEDLLFRTMVTTTRETSAEEGESSVESIQRHTAWRRNLTNLDDEERDTTWSVGDFEKVCKAMMAYVNQKKCPDPADPTQWTIKKYEELYLKAKDDWDNFQLTLDAMKQEYKAWRNVWLGLHDEAFAFDQLAHCTLRPHLASDADQELLDTMDGKEDQRFRERWRILPAETLVHERLAELVEASLGVTQRLTVDETRFRYIRNMYDGYVNAETIQARDCCVCYDPVQKKWALFPCGHLICRECLKSLEKVHGHMGAMPCPSCRKVAKFTEILDPHGIRSRSEDDPGTELVQLQLRGTPQKIEAVVRTIFEVKLKDPTAKMLIFSEYADVLEDYCRVLQRNDLGAVRVKTKEDIPASIEQLRNGDADILLLPIALGGKGLTIIEASHVFFLEPLINRGAELQAIGRIHRMGQTKPTFVHKFIVQGTIEERMHNLMSGIGQADKFTEKELTLRQALNLLQSTGFQGPEEDAWSALEPLAASDTEDAASEDEGSDDEESEE